MLKTTQLFGSLSPGAVSKRRRNSWPDAQAAFGHFRHKEAFAHWDEAVLWDYVNHGTQDTGDKRTLTFDRAVETLFYNTVPDNLERLLERHPLKIPVSFIGGNQSNEIKQVGMDLTHQVTKGRHIMLDGSHLFPMEKPLATAAAIEAALRNMEA
jgi:pimeloyl-ACP methyl ester carboxylesterase